MEIVTCKLLGHHTMFIVMFQQLISHCRCATHQVNTDDGDRPLDGLLYFVADAVADIEEVEVLVKIVCPS